MQSNDCAADEQAIRDLVSTWMSATRTGDRDAVLRLMADDVVFLRSAQEPMRGKAAFAATQDALAGADIDARSEIREIKVIGSYAYCWNHLTVVITPRGGKPVSRAGDVLSILRKDDDGWVIYRDANLLAKPD